MNKKQQEELHELQAERNALQSQLLHSQADAIAHLEHVVGALLLTMDSGEKKAMHVQLDRIETLEPETLETVQLIGETSADIKLKSSRETWRGRLVEVEAQITELEALPSAPIR